MGLILSIQTGRIKTYQTDGHSWRSATFKSPVDGPIRLGRQGFAGDQHADPRYHGGPDKAVLVYSADHHAAWHAEGFPEPVPPGAFGENILVQGMSESTVCIGDFYSLGDAAVQVSQPREPCGKQARRWRIPDLVARMTRSGRTGWYLRVIQEGTVAAGDRFTLRERPHPEWPITKAQQVMHFMNDDAAAAAELAGVSALSEDWKRALIDRF
ncbi:MAG TPA: MOSC domain-containing protein [Bryobacteraceae bacterium]|nr:MOSC domain-containing protein [Bryobacteraceae bacterium]